MPCCLRQGTAAWQGSSRRNRARERWLSAPNHHFLLPCTPYRRSRSPSFGRPCCSQLQPDVLMTPALKWTDSEVGRHFRVGRHGLFRELIKRRISASVTVPRGDAALPRSSGQQLAGPGGRVRLRGVVEVLALKWIDIEVRRHRLAGASRKSRCVV